MVFGIEHKHTKVSQLVILAQKVKVNAIDEFIPNNICCLMIGLFIYEC